jgi:hypothetical protein
LTKQQQKVQTTIEVSMSYQAMAHRRMQALLSTSEDIGRPADLIADLIHYCEHENELYDFEEELRVARLYVDDEQREDAESNYSDSSDDK